MTIKKHSCKAIGGLLFFRPDLSPRIVTVQAWLAKGCPDNVYIYDELWELLAHKIPIVDAQESRGFWVRLHHIKPLSPWQGGGRIKAKPPKIKRASKLDLTHGLVIQQGTAAKIGTREIVC